MFHLHDGSHAEILYSLYFFCIFTPLHVPLHILKEGCVNIIITSCTIFYFLFFFYLSEDIKSFISMFDPTLEIFLDRLDSHGMFSRRDLFSVHKSSLEENIEIRQIYDRNLECVGCKCSTPRANIISICIFHHSLHPCLLFSRKIGVCLPEGIHENLMNCGEIDQLMFHRVPDVDRRTEAFEEFLLLILRSTLVCEKELADTLSIRNKRIVCILL